MSLIPRSFIDEVLSRIDIVELIDARVPLRKTGANFSARCPFHTEKTPSFSVSQTKQFFHCFGCGKSGNAISFLMEHDRLDFVSAIETLASTLGLQIPRESRTPQEDAQQDLTQLLVKAANFYHQQLHQPQAKNYLAKRGLSASTLESFNIGYAPPGWNNLSKIFGNPTPALQSQLVTAGLLVKKEDGNYYDRFRDRIMFPIRNKRGKVIGFGGRIIGEATPKYLNSPETPLFHKGKELYGIFEALQSSHPLKRILIVEGYMDTVMLAQHDIRFTVATLGTATTAEHIQKLLKLSQDIIFCFDGDQAGRTAAWRALETTLPFLRDGIEVRFLFLPEGEDPDSLTQKEGKEKFLTRIENATSLTDFLFNHLSRQVDLTKLEGRARLAKLMSPYLQKIPSSVFQEMLFDRLAHLVRVDDEKLKTLLTPTRAQQSSQPARRKSSTKPLTPMRHAICLLLQNPHLISEINPEENVDYPEIPGQSLLNELVDTLKQHSSTSTGALLEHWRDREEYPLLLKLAALESHIPQDKVSTEFKQALQRIRQLQREQFVEHLMQKAQKTGLSLEEKQLLQSLISSNRTNSSDLLD